MEPLDLAERGEARFYPPRAACEPLPAAGGWHAFRLRVDGAEARLLRVGAPDDEGNAPPATEELLALRRGDWWAISAFSQVLDAPEPGGAPLFGDGRRHALDERAAAFELRPLPPESGNGYELWARGCWRCDAELGLQACGPCGVPGSLEPACDVCCAPGAAPPARRASLAAIFQSMTQVRGCRDDLKLLRLQVPPPGRPWCPRADRARPRHQPRPAVAFRSRLPVPGPRGQLKLEFPLQRASRPSSKNMLLAGADGPVLQFGKARSGRYTIDAQAPLSPVQAMAVGLSLLSWR